jgi:hypothetical protein
MIVGTLNLDQSGAPRTPITKGYLKRRGQITSKAYELVSFPNAPKTFANGITNAGTVDGNYNTRRGDVTSAPAFIRQHGVYSIIDLHALCAEKSEAWGQRARRRRWLLRRHRWRGLLQSQTAPSAYDRRSRRNAFR